ncbi:WD40 repeat domain-containing protein [Synechocystis sp. PCC 7509]|uniref:WD40 repeat domain-containing protein n=1 Tax=Synechocystis sp. PCC 7509 TaxID=927677 RepID=UPI000A04F546
MGQPFVGHGSAVTAISFSPDGQYIVSGSGDNKLKLWQGGNFSSWLKVTCNKLGDRLLLVAQNELANKTCQKYEG